MTITAPSFVFPLLALLALGASESRAAAASAPAAASRQAGPVVTWNPLARPEREADTVFLPDLTSLETIDRSGGFLWGHHNETSAQVKEKFAFGPGRFGPAVRPKPGDDWTFVAFPQDGLIPRDEFTMEFDAADTHETHSHTPHRPAFGFAVRGARRRRTRCVSASARARRLGALPSACALCQRWQPMAERLRLEVLHLHDHAQTLFKGRRTARRRRLVGHPVPEHLHRRAERAGGTANPSIFRPADLRCRPLSIGWRRT
jgi:hypothetical protein